MSNRPHRFDDEDRRALAVDERMKAKRLEREREERIERETERRHEKHPPKGTTLPERYSKNFLSKLDGRIEIARELKAAYEEVTNDLGGVDTLSHAKRALAERFVWLEAIMRGIERKFVELNGDDAEASGQLLSRWVQAVNSLTGLARTLGLERRARKVERLDQYKGRFEKSRRGDE
jgi:hypothetical protein